MTLLPVEGWVGQVDIFLIHLGLGQFEGFAEPLEVDDLPLPQEPNGIAHVWVIAEPEDVVIGQPRLLFWGDFVRTTLHNII